MNPKLACEIFVYDKAGTQLSRGTGYPITRDRILTARHIIWPRKGKVHRIRVVFEHEELDEDGTSQPVTHSDDVTAVFGEENFNGYDVAVLEPKTNLPSNRQPDHQLLHEIPTTDVKVRGRGFPALTKGKTKGRQDSFHGTLSFANSSTFALFDAENSPNDASRWAGASGSGIFNNRTPAIMYGVLTDHRDGKEDSQLGLVPLPALLKSSSFRDAIRYDKEYQPRATHHERVAANTKTILDEWQQADAGSFNSFVEALKECAQEHFPEIKEVKPHKFLLDQCPVDRLLCEMVGLAGGQPSARPYLRRLSGLIVPLNYAADRVNTLRTAVNGGSCCLLEDAVVERSVASIIMAGFDAKPVDMKTDGRIDVEKPPSQGLDPAANSPAQQVKSVLHELYSLLGIVKSDSPAAAMSQRGVAEVLDDEQGRMLRSRLKTRKNAKRGRTAYCIVTLDESSKVRDLQRNVISAVSERVNETDTLLVFIERRVRDDANAEAERDFLADCQYLLMLND